jgi:hypothetical protein
MEMKSKVNIEKILGLHNKLELFLKDDNGQTKKFKRKRLRFITQPEPLRNKHNPAAIGLYRQPLTKACP